MAENSKKTVRLRRDDEDRTLRAVQGVADGKTILNGIDLRRYAGQPNTKAALMAALRSLSQVQSDLKALVGESRETRRLEQ